MNLDRSTLAIQGPPGSGKTYQATHAILELVRAGRRVGVTANSHQVITELLRKLHDLTAKEGIPIGIQHLGDPERFEGHDFPFTVGNDYAAAASHLASEALQIVGGTSFAWANPEMKASVDVLFIEEAGQFSLANALAVSAAAKSLVLLGDPAQLQQPIKGIHPTGAEVSALQHVLGTGVTMPRDLGVFLPETRRLHPDICDFTSQLFYDGRLKSLSGLEQQGIEGPNPWNGAGLRYVPVEHTGNTNTSDEEVESVAAIVNQLFAANAEFRQSDGAPRGLRVGESKKDVLVVARTTLRSQPSGNACPKTASNRHRR